MPGLRTWLLVIYILLWLVLVNKAYMTAGDYTFASCWMIIPSFFLPLGVLMVALAGYSVIILLTSRVRPALRHNLGILRRYPRYGVHGWLGWMLHRRFGRYG